MTKSSLGLAPNDTADTVPALLTTFRRETYDSKDTTEFTGLGVPMNDSNVCTELIADRKVTTIRTDIECARYGAVRWVAVNLDLAIVDAFIVVRISGSGSFVLLSLFTCTCHESSRFRAVVSRRGWYIRAFLYGLIGALSRVSFFRRFG